MTFYKPLTILVVLIYLISPIDLLPDLLGPLGRIDDLALLLFAAYHTVWRDRTTRKTSASSPNSEDRGNEQATAKTSFDTFNLSPSASREEIDSRYRELVKQYHPDRVAHLGEELRALAHEKMIEIQKAYEQLTAGK